MSSKREADEIAWEANRAAEWEGSKVESEGAYGTTDSIDVIDIVSSQ